MASDLVLFDPELVIAQLETIGTGVFRKIAGAADLPAAIENLAQSPAAFVVPIRDTAGASLFGTEQVAQRVSCAFGIVIAEKNLRDTSGQESLKGLRVLRLAVMAKLHGWRPDENYDVFEYAGGRLLQLDVENRVLWWQEDYRTVTDVRTT